MTLASLVLPSVALAGPVVIDFEGFDQGGANFLDVWSTLKWAGPSPPFPPQRCHRRSTASAASIIHPAVLYSSSGFFTGSTFIDGLSFTIECGAGGPADVNADGLLDLFDVQAPLNLFSAGRP